MNCFVTGGRGRIWRRGTKNECFRITRNAPFRFGQNLAWIYYLTLETCLRKNFLFFQKSKMAATAAIMANYEISHNLKSIQVRDPNSLPDPCFQGQGMQWSYHLRSTITATTSKFKWPPFVSKLALWDLTLIHEVLHCGNYKLTGQLITGFYTY